MNIVNYVNGLIKKVSGKADDNGDYSDVLDKINEINSSSRLPEKPNVEAGASYERLEYDAPSDEEIKSIRAKVSFRIPPRGRGVGGKRNSGAYRKIFVG